MTIYTPAAAAKYVAQAQSILQSLPLPTLELMNELIAIINYADWSYYVADQSVLADAEYDQLFALLKSIEESEPTWRLSTSPTQRVASGVSEKFPTAAHMVPMLSLENSYNNEDLAAWVEKNKLQGVSFSVEPKFDGASMSLYYEDDVLVRATTRGDGIQGEDITINAKQMKSIPLAVPFSQFSIQSIEIRGEVIIPKKTFDAYNEQRKAEGLALMANPRNAASGTLRMLDPTEVRKRGLNAFLYHVSYFTMHEGATIPAALAHHYSTLDWLATLGFNTSARMSKVFQDINDVAAYCLEYEEKRDTLDFEIDGMVVKVDSIAEQERIGMTSHHPRWAMAYKFKARQGTSTLEKVEFQVGRTGAITPVAKITPVFIGGVTVSSISLFNDDVIREKDLKIGDKILVERAGDVIPYIVKSFAELRQGDEVDIVFPTACPVCSGAVEKVPGEAAYRCININCDAQVVERIIHFASKDAMDIRNLGDANIRRFYELGFLKHVEDIYSLPFDQLEGLEKLGKKSIENLKKSIEESKQQPIHRLLFGLGIRYVGETTAKTIARAVKDIRDLKDWSIEQLLTLEDVGPKVATAIFDFFQNEANIAMLDRLADLGLQLAGTPEVINENGALIGKTFLFTGTLTAFKRSDAEAQVEAAGGKILSGVSAKLNYLVVGADAGSKLEKAKKLGSVTILSEQEFMELIK